MGVLHDMRGRKEIYTTLCFFAPTMLMNCRHISHPSRIVQPQYAPATK